ncbi:MAG TPA: AI-2E family transporter YdiK [Casimicrobiaceae bacterium]|jgi:predicted PurR-regulated permease PerM|nr:AI-2E family transporter YdiK [Casimicrobiaceae bacterium]
MNDSTSVTSQRTDLTRTVLAVLLMVILIGASFWILRPFLLSIIWAAMIVVATWPLMLRLQARLRSRALAVTIMSGAMVLVFVVPLVLAIQTLVDNADTIKAWTNTLATASIPPPPEWLSRIPLVGAKLHDAWTGVAASGREGLAARLAPHVAGGVQWLLDALGGVGLLGIQFLLTVIIAVIMYTQGEAARAGLIRFGRRLAGDRGEGVVVLAGQAIRGVALGVVVTALAQTVLAGVGLVVAGIPFAGLLTGVVLLLCIAQVGPILVLAPAVFWLFWTDQTVWGSVLLVWTVIVGGMDNVLRPMLIRMGADLPLLLIFAGVLGGLFAFGIVGLFVGPVVLAVTYTLLKDWVGEREPA